MEDASTEAVSVDNLVKAFQVLKRHSGATEKRLRDVPEAAVILQLPQVREAATSDQEVALSMAARSVLREACQTVESESDLAFAGRALGVIGKWRGSLQLRRTDGHLDRTQSGMKETAGFLLLASTLVSVGEGTHPSDAGSSPQTPTANDAGTGESSVVSNTGSPSPADHSTRHQEAPLTGVPTRVLGPLGEIELKQSGRYFELFGIVRPSGDLRPWGRQFELGDGEHAIAVRRSGDLNGALVVATGQIGTRLLRVRRHGGQANVGGLSECEANSAEFLRGKDIGRVRLTLLNDKQIVSESFAGSPPLKSGAEE